MASHKRVLKLQFKKKSSSLSFKKKTRFTIMFACSKKKKKLNLTTYHIFSLQNAIDNNFALHGSKILPFGHQFWALSSIFQFLTIKTKIPANSTYINYTVGTNSQHNGTLKKITSRDVFTILRPISVARSRHQW